MDVQTQAIPLDFKEIRNALLGKTVDSKFGTFIGQTDMQKTSYDIKCNMSDENYNSFGKLIKIKNT